MHDNNKPRDKWKNPTQSQNKLMTKPYHKICLNIMTILPMKKMTLALQHPWTELYRLIFLLSKLKEAEA